MLQITKWVLNEYLPIGLLILTLLTSGRSGSAFLSYSVYQYVVGDIPLLLIDYFECFCLQIGASLISQLSTKRSSDFSCSTAALSKSFIHFLMPFVMINYLISFLHLSILYGISLTDFTLIILVSRVAFSV